MNIFFSPSSPLSMCSLGYIFLWPRTINIKYFLNLQRRDISRNETQWDDFKLSTAFKIDFIINPLGLFHCLTKDYRLRLYICIYICQGRNCISYATTYTLDELEDLDIRYINEDQYIDRKRPFDSPQTRHSKKSLNSVIRFTTPNNNRHLLLLEQLQSSTLLLEQLQSSILLLEQLQSSTLPLEQLQSSTLLIEQLQSSTLQLEQLPSSTLSLEQLESSTFLQEQLQSSTLSQEQLQSSTLPLEQLQSSTIPLEQLQSSTLTLEQLQTSPRSASVLYYSELAAPKLQSLKLRCNRLL